MLKYFVFKKKKKQWFNLTLKNECELKRFMSYLVVYFEQQFPVFKQYYTYFHILFYQCIFSKNTNNVTRTTLLNKPLKSMLYIQELGHYQLL